MSNYYTRFWTLCLALGLLLLPAISQTSAATTGKSQDRWQYYRTAEEAGFSSSGLEEAGELFSSTGAAAVFVVYKGKVLANWGDIRGQYQCHSVRKSFLSALYGIHVAADNIDLEATLEELNIDDDPPLTAAEKLAKVVHLLKSRSGVYHAAAAETQEMRDMRPERGSHAPDTFWYYNNWDFNALGTIFEQETGTRIFEEFKRRIADPIGMQDFRLSDCLYFHELEYSIHPAYVFRMSARDRARFGQLFLQEGRWGDQQIIPKTWVRQSTATHSADVGDPFGVPDGLGYGYMWWTVAKGTNLFDINLEEITKYSFYFAAGFHGQDIIILPDADMVVVFSTDTDMGGQLDGAASFTLLDTIMAAKEFETIDLAITKLKIRTTSLEASDKINIVTKIRNYSRESSTPTAVQFYLSRDTRLRKKDRLIGNAQLRAVKSLKKRTVKLRTTLPENIKPGSYYLIAYVDEENLNYDPDETNNVFVSGKRIAIH